MMSGAGWKDVFDLVVKLVAKEPPFGQIAIGLGAAFSALMFLEGLRANFFPRRCPPSPPQLPRTTSAAPPSASRSAASGAPAAVGYRSVQAPQTASSFVRNQLPRNFKRREDDAISRHRAPRPKIYRHGTVLRREEMPIPANDSSTGPFDAVAIEHAHYQSADSLPQVATFDN